MEDEDEDDIYAPDESDLAQSKPPGANGINGYEQTTKEGAMRSLDESGEELEEDESDSDIDIITEKKEDPKAEQKPRLNTLKTPAPIKSPSGEPVPAQQASPNFQTEHSVKDATSRPGYSYPAVKTSSVDVDAKPIFGPSGKSITDVDMDGDFPEDDKPWRRPGTDMTDYFNYGFDEFTWANYCLKQQSLRKEVADSKKQLDDMQNFMTSGMSGMPGAQGGGIPQMPGMGDVPPEMQQMFAQMVSQGMDPSQMDPSSFMQFMQGGQGGQGGDVNQGLVTQGFAGQQHNQQQMGYSYGGGGGGNQSGRGRGRRW